MGKSCRLSKVCILFVVLALVAVATIATLWTLALTGGGCVVIEVPRDYLSVGPAGQAMGKICRKVCIVFGVVVIVATIATLLSLGDVSEAPTPWDRYRLPPDLVPDYYNITLWPRLMLYAVAVVQLGCDEGEDECLSLQQ